MADIQRIKLRELIPDGKNANKHTERGVYMVNTSLSKLGAGRSILVDKDGEVIAGNLTLEQAIDAGFEDGLIVRTDGKTLVVVQREDMDLSDPHGSARQMAYADNRAAAVSIEFDPDIIAADLVEGVELGDWFTDLEIGKYAPQPEQDAAPQIDRAEELRQEWGVELGQLWRLPSRTAGHEHRLICGDCTDAAVVERVMGGERADIVTTDPPWGVDYDGGTKIREKLENDENAGIFAKFLPLVPYKDDTPLYCWFAHSQSEPTFAAFRASGWEIRSVLIWVKNHAQFGALSAHYKEKKEPIIYAFRKGKIPKWRGPTNEVTVWEADRMSANKMHPTEKPVELYERALRNSSDIDNLVYEPFCGSGTAIIACENLSRQCRAIEISPGYVAVALQRYLDAFGIRGELVQEDS